MNDMIPCRSMRADARRSVSPLYGIRGFTLIELMIVVVVIAILAAVAYPAYTEYVYKSRRADAHAALMNVQFEQQKRRASGQAYQTFANQPSPDGHYLVSVTATGTPPNAFTATAVPQGAQTGDSCGNIVLSVSSDGETSYGSASGASKCWGR